MRSYTGRLDEKGNTVPNRDSGKYWRSFELIFFAAFLIWSAAGLIFTVKHITPAVIAQWPVPDALRQFVNLCQQNGDPILILLACISTHLHAVRQWTAGIARRWSAIVIVVAFVVETYGTHSGFPFGSYHYTDRFGPMLGIIPLAIPLAWHVVVTNALFVVRAFAPHISRLAEAIVVGLLCTIYDFILEPFATVVKQYWAWTDGSVPPLNYVAWFVLSGALVMIFAPTVSTRYRFDPRPLLILGITLMIFLAGELAS